MKILVLSDSHEAMGYMYRCVLARRPDAVIHLGDYFDDGQQLKKEFPGLVLYQVPGNCDRYRCINREPEVLIENIGGVRFFLTHGHRHQVKTDTCLLLRDARQVQADAVLYGHTHIPDCRQEAGLWILNPGSCGGFRPCAGEIHIQDGKITACRLLRQEDLSTEP